MQAAGAQGRLDDNTQARAVSTLAAQLSLWYVWNASSMSQQMLPGHPSFLVGDCHADPGVDFDVAQWVTIP